MNKHIAAAAIATALSVTLLTGCTDGPDNAPVCGSKPVFYNEEDKLYHCSHLWGPIIAIDALDTDTLHKAKQQPGTAVKPAAPAPKPAAPKPAAPAPKPAAPKPAAPAPKPAAPKFK